MAAPFPPQGDQEQRTERPLQVYAEQYLEGGATLPVGAVINPMAGELPLFSDGLPRVSLPAGWALLNVGDWVISSRFSGKPIEVIGPEEFAERFGPST